MHTTLLVSRVLTARRVGSEAQISLRRRRAWFDGEGDTTPAEKPQDGDGKGEGDALPDWVKDPTKAYAEIQKLRNESAEGRQLKKRLDALEKQQKDTDDKKLADQNEWKTLAEQRAEKLAELERKAAEAELKALRVAVAAEFKLPPKLAARLQGATEDELREDAKGLAELIPAEQDEQGKGGAPGGRQSNTRHVPGGQPAKETDEQKRQRLYGGSGSILSGGGLVMPGE